MPKVFLSAGHGGSDPGAVGSGMREKDINLKIMLACKAGLERSGVEVVASRVRDEDDPVQQEVAEANRSGADIAVSFHTNAGGGDGSESFYFEGDPKGRRLAELCEAHTQAIGQNSRGVKTNDLMFTRETYMTAVLCECAFIDNDRDNGAVDTDAECAAFGRAYAAAILEYLGIETEEDMATAEEIRQAVWNTPIWDDGAVYGYEGKGSGKGNASPANMWAFTYINSCEIKATLAAQAEAIKALAEAQGADPDAVAKAVADAVAKKLETIDLNVTVG